MIHWHRSENIDGSWIDSDKTDYKENPFLITEIEASHIKSAPDKKYYPDGYWLIIVSQEYYGSKIPNTIFLLPYSIGTHDNIINRAYKFANTYNKTRKGSQFGYKPTTIDARRLETILKDRKKKSSKSKLKITKKCKCK